ncbi:hypothetical protein D3P09_13630 [Paenibacillus pinisoli]|uniref:Uncharacterized protein n=1 Tax=Paenibacillus pinisoli TaxID=1276110 RepID=A0A3A6PRY8_9BACL|nr:hypothetical protein D3P09_13630 [Paenibacillus pinisoli]
MQRRIAPGSTASRDADCCCGTNDGGGEVGAICWPGGPGVGPGPCPGGPGGPPGGPKGGPNGGRNDMISLQFY